jgi:hypothetical protein
VEAYLYAFINCFEMRGALTSMLCLLYSPRINTWYALDRKVTSRFKVHVIVMKKSPFLTGIYFLSHVVSN